MRWFLPVICDSSSIPPSSSVAAHLGCWGRRPTINHLCMRSSLYSYAWKVPNTSRRHYPSWVIRREGYRHIFRVAEKITILFNPLVARSARNCMMEKHSPPGQAPSTTKGPNSLTSKINTVLSTSYVDSEFRDALSLLDQRGFQNTAKERRQLRLGLQREVIDGNGEIISEFGRVADVS